MAQQSSTAHGTPCWEDKDGLGWQRGCLAVWVSGAQWSSLACAGRAAGICGLE